MKTKATPVYTLGLKALRPAIGVLFVALAAAAAPQAGAVATAAADPAQTEFFEKSVRPLLEEHCVECHSAAKGKTKGGLALDNAAAVRKGGDTGPALVAGAPEKSLLLKAVTYNDPDLKMPPDNKRLSAEQVAVLERWIKSGAFDPREGKSAGPDPELAKRHWAFQPVKVPALPAVREAAWARTDTDRFVLAALESKNLRPSPEADRATLLRRASYDLHGLPPTEAELQAFLADSAPDAYERAVDRMLASPRFGERWGRYWLDVARYSDTKGLPAPINADRRFHFAYSYRDYVIEAFNTDKPFNQFILEQLAADLLPEPKPANSLAALGYLTVGRCFQNSIHDIIDDRIDVVSRGLLGLTVSCARCHDHKYDPIPTADYYSLHGVFLSTEEPKERPVIGAPAESPQRTEYLEKRAKMLAKMDSSVEGEVKKANEELVKKIPDYLLAAMEVPKNADPKSLDTMAGERKLIGLPLSRWAKLLQDSAQDPVFGPWNALAALPKPEFEAQAAALLAQWKSAPPAQWNPAVIQALASQPLKSLADAAKVYGQLCSETAAAMEKRGSENATPLENPVQESLRSKLFQETAPGRLSRAEVEKSYSRKVFEARSKVQDELDVLDSTDPAAPPRAMALFDKPQPVQPVVFVRGNAANRGPNVPRQFLGILAGESRKPFAQGSGRLEMAQAIADPANPLTARVAVNRIWLHLFGRGLIDTPNDFGVRTAPPAIPGVLDHLAARFVQKGWSTKAIVRELMLSSAYRQSSAPRPDAANADPGNDLLHAQRRRRLDFEALRDTLLKVSGRLDETRGGRSVELTKPPFSERRSVYGYIDRQDLPSMFRFFDLANPDISTGQRFETTVPQQALFLMNHDFLKNLAESLSRDASLKALAPGAPRVEALFRKVLLRAPSPSESAAALELLGQFQPSGDQADKPWACLAQALLLTNELAFVD